MLEQAGKAISLIASTLTVAGAALYALIWSSYSAFYSRLGLSPDDVGLTQTDIIRTAAIGLAYFLATSSVLVFGWIEVCRLVAKIYSSKFRLARENLSLKPQTRSRQILGRILTFPTIATIGTAILLPVTSLLFNDFVFVPPFAKFVVLAVSTIVAASVISSYQGPDGWAYTPTFVAAWCGTAGVVFLCSVSVLILRTEGLADDLLDDGRPSATFFLFSLREDPVCVTNQEGHHFYLLLGDSAQGTVLFDPVRLRASKLSKRVQEESSVEYLGRGATACP